MAYDLRLVETLFAQLKVHGLVRTENQLDVELEPGVVLCFVNDKNNDADSLIGFKGTPWHFHGDIGFSDNRGYAADMSYGDLILGLADGTVLVCERWLKGNVVDRWLIHSEYPDHFRFMEPGENLKVKRLELRV